MTDRGCDIKQMPCSSVCLRINKHWIYNLRNNSGNGLSVLRLLIHLQRFHSKLYDD